MSISADTLALLVAQGISGQALVAIVRSIEADAGPSKSAAAERQRRYRERQNVKADDVTRDVTRDVTECDAPPPPAPSFPQTPNQPHPPTPGETPRTRKGTRLPADFAMPEDWIEWAVAERSWARAEAESEGDSFCDHWRAKPGAAATKLDWQATWRVWVRNSRRNGRNGQRHHHHDRFGDRMRDPVLDDLARGIDP